MVLTNEDNVTKILSQKEIIKNKNLGIYNANPNYNLGDFLIQETNTLSRWDSRYLFVK